ncbi:MAG: YihY/virulence factor BrkB family protein [Proteobacteria bacterium]|nr:YihY/virulence factor BrkB family protein [Pseudomonadota bacterium]
MDHRPSEIGAGTRPRWWDFLAHIWAQFTANHLSILAAGVAFYGFLSLFPGLVALVALYGLVADPVVVEAHLASLGGILPDAAQSVLSDQLKTITAHSSTSLSFALVVSLGFAWWSAAAAMKALMEALNIAYGETERRSWWRFNIEALLLTLGAILVVIDALVGVVVMPIVLKFLDRLGLPSEVGDMLAFARWPVLAAFILFGLAVLYRFGPSRAQPTWRWLSPGAITTTALWLLGSALLSFYVATFDTYNRTYGSLAAVVILMLWLELSAFLVILGAQINGELERRAAAAGGGGAKKP